MKKLALTLAMVLFVGCATTYQPQVEVGTVVHNIRVGYTDITDQKTLSDIKPTDVIFSVNLPKGTKTVVCFVQLSCPKGTPIVGAWWLNGKKFYTLKDKAPRDLAGMMMHFWYSYTEGLASGEWKFDISLSGEKLDSVKFTVLEEEAVDSSSIPRDAGVRSPSNTWKCEKCGATISAEFVECPNCGEPRR
jgi:hypothetical protein